MPKTMNLEGHFTPYTGINSKWLIGFNIRDKTIKLSEENRKEKLKILG